MIFCTGRRSVALVLGVAAVGLMAGCSRPAEDMGAADDLLAPASSSSAASSSDTEADAPGYAWAKAVAPRAFSVPADHGAHRDFRIEWW
ncbi:MAG: hypothetical protein AAF790_15595, partial [Planctomycetota bacterium]